MKRTVAFHRLAERELNDAAQYHDLESPGLGVTLLKQAERCLKSILKHPEACPVIAGEIHRRLTPGFP